MLLRRRRRYAPAPGSPPGRRERERGAVLVEAVFVVPILFLFTFATIEWGMAFSTISTTTASTRSGARLGATSYAATGNKAQMVIHIGEAIADDLGALSNADPLEAWVYRANTGPPTSCTEANRCWRMGWNSATGAFNDPVGGWSDPDACGATTGDKHIDDLGVMVRTRHHFVSGMFGATRTITERTTIRLEPLPTDQC